MTQTSIIPLSLTVMLGPQILVAMLLITRKDAIRSSLVYIIAVVSTLVATTYVYYSVASITHFHKISISGKPILKYILVLFLFYVLVKTIVNRKKITKQPKWLTNIHNCSLPRVFYYGFMLIAFMPGDIAVEFTIGNLLNSNNESFTDAIPFFAAVALITCVPLFTFLTLGKKGHEKMEKANTWLNTHGYLINVVTLSIFILLLLF